MECQQLLSVLSFVVSVYLSAASRESLASCRARVVSQMSLSHTTCNRKLFNKEADSITNVNMR